MEKISWLLVFFYSTGIWSQGEVKKESPLEMCGTVKLELINSGEYIPPQVSIDSTTIYQFVDQSAEYTGSATAMKKFMKDSLQFPKRALDIGVEGKCFLMFVVERDGTITNIQVIRGVPDCSECDREAIRVIKLMPKMKPGKLEGTIVRSQFNLVFPFKSTH